MDARSELPGRYGGVRGCGDVPWHHVQHREWGGGRSRREPRARFDSYPSLQQLCATGSVARQYYAANGLVDLRFDRVVQELRPLHHARRGRYGSAREVCDTDDLKLFSVNDNLTATGVRLDLKLAPDLGFFILGEWGTDKNGGPM